MKFSFPARCLIVLGSVVTGVRADQADSVIVAAMKLSSVANYGWTTTIEQGSRITGIDGKTNDSGYSLVTFHNAASPGGGNTSAVFLGDSKYVVQAGNGWVNPGSLPEDSPPSDSSNGSRGAGGGGRSGAKGGGSGMSLGGIGLGGAGRRGGRGGGSRSGSQNSAAEAPARLPSGINLPHEELAIIVANYTNLHFDGNVASGSLTESGSDLLLSPAGSAETPPAGATGTFRLWIKDGAVTKYQVHLSAKTAPGGRAVKGGFSETINVELEDVGSTKFDVPDAAKQRLTS